LVLFLFAEGTEFGTMERRSRLKKQNILYKALMLGGVCLLCGCSKEAAGDSASENRISVSEEIAGGVSEDVIPEEAFAYNDMSFPVPEEFVEWEDNTETNRVYISTVPEDYSYISYSRSTRGEGEAIPTEEEMQAAVQEAFDGGELVSYLVEETEDYVKCAGLITFQNERADFRVWSYTYITEQYVFYVSFAQGGAGDWENTFVRCAEEIVLTNVLGEELQ
jgi:hypothetical protein